MKSQNGVAGTLLAGSLRNNGEGAARLSLVNGPTAGSTDLLRVIERAAKETTRTGTARHLYILTCYFDIDALRRLVERLRRTIRKAGGKLRGVTVAMDMGEWIRCRISEKVLVREIGAAAKLAPGLVLVVPVHVTGRLLHAKAYAAIRSDDNKSKRGFVVITSGNATGRGLGLVDASNLELATVLTDTPSLVTFETIMKALATRKVSPATALKQDEYLRALALFGRGAFYHKWQSALASEARFTLTLTDAGKREATRKGGAFRDFEHESGSISRDPLKIQEIFKALPKPFPEAFWRTHGADTLLGYWLPEPIAELVDTVLKTRVDPYLSEIDAKAAPIQVVRWTHVLDLQVKEFSAKGWIEETAKVTRTWAARVKRYQENRELIAARLLPFERLPDDVLRDESRTLVLQTFQRMRDQLFRKTAPKGTKGVLKRFVAGALTLSQVDEEFAERAAKARETLVAHGQVDERDAAD